MDLLNQIADTYLKIIKVNIDEDSFQTIKSENNEEVKYHSFSRWVIDFAQEDNLYSDDYVKFINFTNIYRLKGLETTRALCYRRKKNGVYIWSCMEIIPTEDENIIFLTVKDIAGHVDYLYNVPQSCVLGGIEELNAFFKANQDAASMGAITIRHYDSQDIGNIVREFSLDNATIFNVDGYLILVYKNYDCNLFYNTLVKLHKELKEFSKIDIGSYWLEDSSYDYSLIERAINKT